MTAYGWPCEQQKTLHKVAITEIPPVQLQTACQFDVYLHNSSFVVGPEGDAVSQID